MNSPGFLYHNTGSNILLNISKSGLLPRVVNSASNYSGIEESKAEYIYLSSTDAPYYACFACRNAEGEPNGNELVVIELKSDSLAEELLIPDEDYSISNLYNDPQYKQFCDEKLISDHWTKTKRWLSLSGRN